MEPFKNHVTTLGGGEDILHFSVVTKKLVILTGGFDLKSYVMQRKKVLNMLILADKWGRRKTIMLT